MSGIAIYEENDLMHTLLKEWLSEAGLDLAGIDLPLRDTANWYEHVGDKIAPGRLDEVLANRTAGVRQARLLTIVDAQGIQLSQDACLMRQFRRSVRYAQVNALVEHTFVCAAIVGSCP
jgi:hypothetical protein